MKHEVLDLGLVLYTEAVEDPAKIISDLEALDKRFLNNEHLGEQTMVDTWTAWTDGAQTFNYQKFVPRSKDVNPRDHYAADMKDIADRIYGPLDRAFDHYANTLYPFAGKNIKNEEFNMHILKYGDKGYLPKHQDHGVSSRVLSAVLYLNDDYEGGEIEFMHSNQKIKPPAGSIIFFPSNFLYVHEVHQISSGFRYALPHWYHNRKEMYHSTGEE